MPKSYPIHGSATTHLRDDPEPILREIKKVTSRRKMNARQIIAKNLTALIEHQRSIEGPLATFQAIEDATARLGQKVGRSTVDRISKGTTPGVVDNLEAIAKAFKLQLWQLLIPGLVPGAAPVLRSADKQDRLSEEALEIALQLDSIRNPDMREVAVAKAYVAAFRPQKPLPPVDQSEDQATPTDKRSVDG